MPARQQAAFALLPDALACLVPAITKRTSDLYRRDMTSSRLRTRNMSRDEEINHEAHAEAGGPNQGAVLGTYMKRTMRNDVKRIWLCAAAAAVLGGCTDDIVGDWTSDEGDCSDWEFTAEDDGKGEATTGAARRASESISSFTSTPIT